MRSRSINIDGVTYEAHAYNCAIFMFPTEYISHNHVFLVTDEENNTGVYIFGRPDVIETLGNSGDFPIHYLPYVPDGDMAAYKRWAESRNSITEEEIAKFHEQAERDGVIGHWDELEGGEQ